MSFPLRRTILGLSAIGAISLVRAANVTMPSSPEVEPTPAGHADILTKLQDFSHEILAETVTTVLGPIDTASAATPCDPRDTTVNPDYCYRATPTPTPKPAATPKPATPKPTPRPTAVSGGGGGGSASGGGGSANTECANDGPLGDNPLVSGAGCAQANGTSSNLFGTNGMFQTMANTLIYLVGAISVIFLIIGGMRYVISQGDAKATGAAKDTILYAIIGIVVAVVSFALINFVINALSKTA